MLVYRAECRGRSSNAARQRSRRWRCRPPAAQFHWVRGVPASAGWQWHSLGGWWSWPAPSHPGSPGVPRGSGRGCFSAPRGLSSDHSLLRSSQIYTGRSWSPQSYLQHKEHGDTVGSVPGITPAFRTGGMKCDLPVHLHVWLKNLVGHRSLSSTFLRL